MIAMDAIEFYRTMNDMADNSSGLWISKRNIELKGISRKHTRELYEIYQDDLLEANAFLDSVVSACPPYMAGCFLWYNTSPDRVLIARLVDDTLYRSIFGVNRHRLMMSVEWHDTPLDPVLQDGIRSAIESADERLVAVRDRVWHYVDIAIRPLGMVTQERNDGNIERAIYPVDAGELRQG